MPTVPFDLSETLKAIAKLWGYFVATFLWRLFLYLIIAAIVASAVYGVLRRPESWSGPIGAGIAFLFHGGFSVMMAVDSAIGLTVVKAIEASGLGKSIFDFIISLLAGKTPETPDGENKLSHSVDGLTESELRDALHNSANDLILKVGEPSRVPLPVRWFSTKVFSIGTWGMVKLIMAFASEKAASGTKHFSTEYIRTELGSKIEATLCSSMRDTVNQRIKIATCIFSALLLGIASIVRCWL